MVTLDVNEIRQILPHRYPFLLVDRIVELEPDKRVVGLKNVTINEQFFQGHFPGAPVMPGVLILEAMAQVAGILIYRDMPEPDRATKLIYFTGIEWGRSERLFAFLLPVTGKPIVISPAFEQQRAEDQVKGRFDIRVWQEDQNPEVLVADTLNDLGLATGRLAIDSSARTFVFTELAQARPGMQFGSAAIITNQCRGVKSAHEIEIMRFANQITVEAYRVGFRVLRAGMTQAEMVKTIGDAMSKMGYPGGVFALFGESSAYPHGLPKPRSLEENQVVLVDGGLSVHGYQSDITRTAVFGTPSPEAQKVFEILQEAQARALAFAGPGKKCGDVDAVARKVVTDAGYGPDYRTFTHRLGHGIGLEGHEWPYFVRGSQIIIEPGMTFSDEPGIYQYGKFGIRVEDIMAITENGAEMLTPPQTSLSPALT